MSTHNICIRREIRKILCGYPLLSVAIKDVGANEARLYKETSGPSCSKLTMSLVNDSLKF